MKRHIWGYILVSLIFFLMGTTYGVKYGVENYYHLNNMPTALIDTAYYKKIEAGSFNDYKNWTNFKLDSAIDSYLWCEENGSTFLSRIFFNDYLKAKEEYINKLIDFRNQIAASEDLSALLDGESKTLYLDQLKKRNSLLLSRGVPQAQLTQHDF